MDKLRVSVLRPISFVAIVGAAGFVNAGCADVSDGDRVSVRDRESPPRRARRPSSSGSRCRCCDLPIGPARPDHHCEVALQVLLVRGSDYESCAITTEGYLELGWEGGRLSPSKAGSRAGLTFDKAWLRLDERVYREYFGTRETLERSIRGYARVFGTLIGMGMNRTSGASGRGHPHIEITEVKKLQHEPFEIAWPTFQIAPTGPPFGAGEESVAFDARQP